MKNIYGILLVLIISGCFKQSNIEFAGTVPGVKSGVFIIKTLADSTAFGVNIKDGKFAISKRPFKSPGYYMMDITDDDNKDDHAPFEVYLDGGNYTIETEQGKLYKYPKITSGSKTQQELSAFYTLSDSLSIAAKKEADRLNNVASMEGKGLSAAAYTKVLDKLSTAQNKVITNNTDAFREYLKRYPNNDISAHLMEKLNYDDDPASYYELYKTFSPAAKNSDEGKEIGDKLARLVKLVVGAQAPPIYGKTTDGKPFDEKSITSKVILVDFWRAGNEFGRRNHPNLAAVLNSINNKQKFTIVSVSLDVHQDWWTNAINEDNMSWTQVSDLKGDDSPNAANWCITEIPTYFLVSSDWKILERNINIAKVEFDVSDYLSKHP